MLPSSHAWRMLCRLYGLLLKQEWARRLAEIGAAAGVHGIGRAGEGDMVESAVRGRRDR